MTFLWKTHLLQCIYCVICYLRMVLSLKTFLEKTKSSQYHGVSWITATQRWIGSVHYKGKSNYAGTWKSEIDAAYSVNLLCDKLGLPRKNPQIGDPPDDWTPKVNQLKRIRIYHSG